MGITLKCFIFVYKIFASFVNFLAKSHQQLLMLPLDHDTESSLIELLSESNDAELLDDLVLFYFFRNRLGLAYCVDEKISLFSMVRKVCLLYCYFIVFYDLKLCNFCAKILLLNSYLIFFINNLKKSIKYANC